MSEASSDCDPHPPSADLRGQDGWEVDPGYFGKPYPLDPPLVDVRIPVSAPHSAATVYSRYALMDRYPDAEVGDDLHILFREPSAGEREGPAPRKKEPGKSQQSRLAPDIFVALKVPRQATRADYDVDELGPPDFVLEVLSQSTWRHDVGRKLDCYQQIGVRECVLFDVSGEDLAGCGKDLWGFALTPDSREPLKGRVLPNGKHGVYSEVLGLVAYVAARTPPSAVGEIWALTMRWHDPATAEDIPDYHESLAQAVAERARADAARAQADAAQARADEAQARAEAEAHRRRAAELEERLRRLGEGGGG